MVGLMEWLASKSPKTLRLSVWFDVFVERYYPLRYGMPAKDGSFDHTAAWPNVFLHHLAEQLDEFAHDHGRWAVSIIMSGGYEEWRPGWKEWRKRGVGNITFQAFDESHLIRNLLPNTWTVFIVGPFVRPYLIYRPEGVVRRSEMMDSGEHALTSLLPDTPELRDEIAFRQRAKERFFAKRARQGNLQSTSLLPATPEVLAKVAARQRSKEPLLRAKLNRRREMKGA